MTLDIFTANIIKNIFQPFIFVPLQVLFIYILYRKIHIKNKFLLLISAFITSEVIMLIVVALLLVLDNLLIETLFYNVKISILQVIFGGIQLDIGESPLYIPENSSQIIP